MFYDGSNWSVYLLVLVWSVHLGLIPGRNFLTSVFCFFVVFVILTFLQYHCSLFLLFFFFFAIPLFPFYPPLFTFRGGLGVRAEPEGAREDLFACYIVLLLFHLDFLYMALLVSCTSFICVQTLFPIVFFSSPACFFDSLMFDWFLIWD